MPWGVSDVEKHIKGLSDKQKEVWVAVANDVLKRSGDEGQAIASANAAAKRAKSNSVREAMEARVGKGL